MCGGGEERGEGCEVAFESASLRVKVAFEPRPGSQESQNKGGGTA